MKENKTDQSLRCQYEDNFNILNEKLELMIQLREEDPELTIDMKEMQGVLTDFRGKTPPPEFLIPFLGRMKDSTKETEKGVIEDFNNLSEDQQYILTGYMTIVSKVTYIMEGAKAAAKQMYWVQILEKFRKFE